MLEFQGETLAVALDEFRRYTTTEFDVDDPGLLNETVGGAVPAGDVEQLLIALRNGLAINSEWTGDDRILLRRPQGLLIGQ